MVDIETYSAFKELKVRVDFILDYIDYDDSEEDIIPFNNHRKYTKGQKILVIAKVKSSKCNSGYGYIIFDKELEVSSVVDVNLFD